LLFELPTDLSCGLWSYLAELCHNFVYGLFGVLNCITIAQTNHFGLWLLFLY